MDRLTRDDLFSLGKYAEIRREFRAGVMEHKKHRKLQIGPNLTLIFEDRMSMQYPIQEMLRIEKIFEPDAIQEELETYNPLIPDGRNWKATLLIEYPDVEERRKALSKLAGVENRVWVRIGNGDKVLAIADEDLDRATADKTSVVHFLRFELTVDMVRQLKEGAVLAAGVEHNRYAYQVDPVPTSVRASLLNDLD